MPIHVLTYLLVMTDPAIDRVFAALSSPARRRMLDLIEAHPGTTIAGLTDSFRMSGVGVLKHVRVLERAGLVIGRREGRVRRLYFNPVPIQAIYDRWTDRYASFWAGRMADLKDSLEHRLARGEGAMGPGPAPARTPAEQQRKAVASG